MTAGGFDHDRLVRDALALHRNGQLSHAEGVYRGILSRDPNHVDALNCLGLLCVQTGRALEAESLLRKAMALDPNFSAVHNHLGGALQQQGSMDQAIVCYRRAVELDAENLAAYTNLADALRLTGRIDEAIGLLSAPLKARFPQAAQVIGNIGVQLAQANRFSQAAECFRRAIDAAPDSVDAHRNLGEVLRGMGHLDESLAAYRKALQLDPKRADVHSFSCSISKLFSRIWNSNTFSFTSCKYCYTYFNSFEIYRRCCIFGFSNCNKWYSCLR